MSLPVLLEGVLNVCSEAVVCLEGVLNADSEAVAMCKL